jgi:hypothetical protein
VAYVDPILDSLILVPSWRLAIRARSLTVKETYVERQARLDAEVVDRWVIKVADMAPMSDEQIRSLAVILNRIDARLARERAGNEVISPTFT